MFRGQSPRMGEQPHSPHRVHTLAGPLTGRRDRVCVGVVVGRTHSSCRVAALYGSNATAAACPHLVMCQANVWDAAEAEASILAHDKAAQPVLRFGLGRGSSTDLRGLYVIYGMGYGGSGPG
jgi:hypothetical protein